MKYIAGTTVQNKRSRISYKNRKLRANPKEQWNIVENTHEPIIDKKVFEAVQKMVTVQKYNRCEKKHQFLLDGLLFCYECNHKIGVRSKKNGYMFMVCNNYRRNSKLGICTSHGFNYYTLEKKILEYIKNLFLKIDSHKIEISIKNSLTKYDYEKMLEKIENNIHLLNDNIDTIHLEKINNQISKEMYDRLFSKLTKEINQKKEEYKELKTKNQEFIQDNNKEIEKIVNSFLKLEEPTPELMKVIINRIEIHQDKQVDIIFNFKRLNEISMQTSAKREFSTNKK